MSEDRWLKNDATGLLWISVGTELEISYLSCFLETCVVSRDWCWIRCPLVTIG